MIRLLNRGDDVNEIIRRIESDRELFDNFMTQCDYIIDNNNVHIATEEVIKLMERGTL